MSEWQLVDPREFQDLREIEAGNRFLRLSVIEVLNHLTAGGIESAIGIRESLRPSVRGNEAQAVRRSLANHELERVIRGIAYSRIIVDEA